MLNGQCSLKGCTNHATTCWSGNNHGCVRVCEEHVHAEGPVGYDDDELPWSAFKRDPTTHDEDGRLID